MLNRFRSNEGEHGVEEREIDHLAGALSRRRWCLLVAETGIDVRDDGYHVGLVVVDLVQQALLGHGIAGGTGGVELAEQATEFTRIGLLEEGVEFLDQLGHGGFFVHGLVGQRAELGTQRCDHPAGQVQVFFLGGAEVLLDGNQLLLADESVPTAQGLRVRRRVGIILFHVFAHDVGGVLGNFQSGSETVLKAHTGCGFRADGCPRAAGLLADTFQGGDFFAVV